MTVSLKDVAALAGVSAGTVSNVLNNPERVSSDTAQRVNRAIDMLGYVRNDAARRLRAGRSNSIGLVVLDVGNPFFGELVRGAEDAAVRAGFTVLVSDSRDNPQREAAQVALFGQQRVHGVLLSPVDDARPALESLRPHDIPLVLVDRAQSSSGVPSVAVDDVSGGALAVDHLIARGRSRIGYVGGPMNIRQVTDRLTGARTAVSPHSGVSLEVLPTAAMSVQAGRQAGQQIVERQPHERPDAIFAANDLLAFGVLQSLMLSDDIAVPDEMMLVGYDDIDFAQAAIVPLTSVRQPARLIGEKAMELLLGAASGESRTRQVVYQPSLVERASTTK